MENRPFILLQSRWTTGVLSRINKNIETPFHLQNDID